MTEKEDRKLKQVSMMLYEDQIEPLDRLWKRKFLDSRNELIRNVLDDLLEKNKE